MRVFYQIHAPGSAMPRDWIASSIRILEEATNIVVPANHRSNSVPVHQPQHRERNQRPAHDIQLALPELLKLLLNLGNDNHSPRTPCPMTSCVR